MINRSFQVELNALDWIDDKDNWGLWRRELRGRSVKAHILAWLRKRVVNDNPEASKR
jgi:hypothetical protein